MIHVVALDPRMTSENVPLQVPAMLVVVVGVVGLVEEVLLPPHAPAMRARTAKDHKKGRDMLPDSCSMTVGSGIGRPPRRGRQLSSIKV
jgi:hypothetical protein